MWVESLIQKHIRMAVQCMQMSTAAKKSVKCSFVEQLVHQTIACYLFDNSMVQIEKRNTRLLNPCQRTYRFNTKLSTLHVDHIFWLILRQCS
uniref:Uncharacterized protein n=1 Tax=Romanomermis culicivorax TaxID=13658 RepID=A0A915L963_ROMCU